ncbi:MAG TPA: PAS domain S-box protein [Ktedonobacterales bacterium]
MEPPEEAQKPQRKTPQGSLAETLDSHDITERKRREEALRASEEKYRSLFESIDEGFCLIEVIYDEHGAIADLVFREVNPAFEGQTGLSNVVDKTVGELLPSFEPYWIDIYSRVARTGESLRTENYVQDVGRWYDVYFLRVGGEESHLVAVVFSDITEHKQARSELQRAYERFSLAERATNGFVYEWNPRDGIHYRSEGFERMLGYRPEEIPPTWAAWARLVYPGDWEVVTDAEELAYLDALPGDTLEHEYRVRHRDGHYLTVAEHTVIERDEVGHVVRLIGQIQDITERLQTEEARQRAQSELEQRVAERTRELDNANKELRRLSQRILEVQEGERRIIARELHDEIGQQLTGVKMLLETLEESVQDGGGSSSPKGADSSLDRSLYAPSLSEISAAVATTLERVRDLSLDLRPAVLDSLGLLPALQWLFERYTRLTGVTVDFSVDGLDHRLPARFEAGIYRIIQEALTNVSRHAGVTEVIVQIYVTEEDLSLYVVDAGAGFDIEEALVVGGSTGLAGMRERADLLAGTLTIDSIAGEGTTIHAKFPVMRAIEMEAAHETDEDFAYMGWQTPEDDSARHQARDDLRDRARDKYRDASRDARRDTLRDALRDMTRDATRDAARDAMRDQQREREDGKP